MTTGIYKLTFDGTDKVYIGQSIHIETRFSKHLLDMGKGTASKKLQEAFYQYGKPILHILLECSAEDLNESEIEAISLYKAIEGGFNTQIGGGDFPILYGETNPYSKYSNAQILEIFNYLLENREVSLKIVSARLNFPISTIKNIANGYGHKWIKEAYPEKYEELMSIKGNRPINSLEYSGRPLPKVLSPDGEVFIVTHITNFAKEHGLNRGAFGQVLLGHTIHHKGWKLKNE